MLTKVVVSLLAVVAVSFAGTSLYENRDFFSKHTGSCHHSACTSEDAGQTASAVTAAKATCDSAGDEPTCCSATSKCCLAGNSCCDTLMAGKSTVDRPTLDDDGFDPW